MFSPVFLYVSRITQTLLVKSLYGILINPATNRLDFSGNPDLDPDPGIFEGILLLRY